MLQHGRRFALSHGFRNFAPDAPPAGTHMTVMRLNKEILRLTIPAIISNITMPLLGLCDTTVAGHLGSEAFIGAVAVGTMMQNVVFWMFGFLRMGTTGMTAQCFGADDMDGCRRILWRTLTVGLTVGLLILLLRPALRELLLMLIGPQGEVRSLASTYFDICIWGAPAMLVTMSLQGWLLGMQTTLLPMTVTVTVNVLNIGLSLLFVYVGGMGFPGVAYGTLAATCCGVPLAVFAAMRRMRGKSLRTPLREVFAPDGLLRFLRVNSDIFLRSACIIGVSMTVTAIGARLGAMTLAANAVMIQFFVFFSYCMDGFAFTGEALCGRFAGGHDLTMLRRSVRRLLMWSAAMALLFTTVYALFYGDIISFITNDQAVIDTIRHYRGWIFAIPVLSVMAFIYDGFFIGMTATRRMLVVTAIASAIFMTVSFVHFRDGSICIGLPENNVLWMAFMSYLLARGSLLAVQSRTVMRHAALGGNKQP